VRIIIGTGLPLVLSGFSALASWYGSGDCRIAKHCANVEPTPTCHRYS
jgi:hypothetical protein